MKPHYRTATNEHDRLTGRLIERSQPVTFHLNGVKLQGCLGDTVLSAALSNGIVQAGQFNGHPIGLTLRSAPVVYAHDRRDLSDLPLPMARTPIWPGARFWTEQHVGARARLGAGWRGLVKQAPDSLDVKFASDDRKNTMPAVDRHALDVDVLVIGAGVSGLAAAVAASKSGDTVLLVDRAGGAGGLAHFFSGHLDDRETHASTTQQLDLLLENGGTFWSYAETLQLTARAATIHRIAAGGDKNEETAPHWADVSFKRVVLATGARSALPLVSGNLRPGVWSADELFRLAHDYGVVPGRTALLWTGQNQAVSAAMRLAEAGLTVRRIIDRRVAPQSRFYDYSNALGIGRMSGLGVSLKAGQHNALAVTPVPLEFDAFGAQDSINCDILLTGGAFIPELALAACAGCGVTMTDGKLVAGDFVSPIFLCGSAAGYLSEADCIASGTAAGLGKAYEPSNQDEASETYESMGQSLPVEALNSSDESCFLTDEMRFGHLEPMPKDHTDRDVVHRMLHERSYSVAEVHALCASGRIGDKLARVVLAERLDCRLPTLPFAGDHPASGDRDTDQTRFVPGYLEGRFGAKQASSAFRQTGEGGLAVGQLLFQSAQSSDPSDAIGLVLRSSEDGEWIGLFSEVGLTLTRFHARQGARTISCTRG